MTFIPQSAPSCNPLPRGDLSCLLEEMCRIAGDAGRMALSLRAAGLVSSLKADGSQVTQADVAVGEMISARLSPLLPGVPIVCEENIPLLAKTDMTGTFWLVDPVDATRKFISGQDDFSVNIALVSDRYPVLGVVAGPARDVVYAGGKGIPAFCLRDGGKIRHEIHPRSIPESGAVVFATLSRSRFSDGNALDAILGGMHVAERIYLGSALKFCAIAAGEADVYVRIGETGEWDTAAGQAILESVGCGIRTLDGMPLRYGKTGFLNESFIATR
ncbi:MAG: hypothetical protein A2018_03635 [Alphaproteobacteria bacterium GWF2_58_20]|nr:MAG: hypothetical protein A2018_03635 [Alphaproteobacteria bacterium GWF2_58_20]